MKKLRLFLAALLLSVGSILPITASMVHAVTYTCTWTGTTDTKFSTATNWSNCNSSSPTNGDSLIFDATSLSSGSTVTNDLTGLSLTNITFQGTNTSGFGYTIAGNAITLTSGISLTANNVPTITAPIVLGGNVAFSNTSPGGYDAFINGIISGTGNVVTTGGWYLGGTNTFTGTVTASSGHLEVTAASALGASSNAVTVSNGASLSVGGCTDTGFTFPYALTLNGTGAGSYPTLSDGGLCSGSGGGSNFTELYQQASTNTTQSYTLSGAITLGSNITFGGIAKTTTITGALSGAFNITVPNTYGGQLIINSSNNTSSIKNGTYNPAAIVQTLSDSQPSNTVFIGQNATITITGVRGATEVGLGGVLKGSGTVGALTIDTDGTVAPGDAPACLTTGSLTLNGTYSPEIDGTTACTGYDQLKVNGTVTITGATLSPTIVSGFKPAAGQSYEIIDNLGGSPVSGTFTGLAEGATFTVSGYTFKITYKGAGGNNVVITVMSAPGTPNTGFSTIAAHPAETLGVSVIASGVIFGLALKNKKRLAFARSKSSRK